MNPKTMREALIAEALGDLDALMKRVEALPSVVVDAEKSIAATAATLEAAGDKYRMAVTAFNEQAKEDLSGYLNLKLAQADQAAKATALAQGNELLEAIRAEIKQTQGAQKPFSQLLQHATTAAIAVAVAMIFNGFFK